MSVLLLHWFDFLDFSTFLKIYLFGFVLKFAILLVIQWKNDRFKFNMSIKDIDIKELIRFGVFVMVGGTSIMIVTRVDMMMIGSLLDLQQVAFYTVAFFIGNAIKVPAKSIGAISIPLVAMAWENQDYKQIQTLYSKSSINQLIIGGVFFVCIWLNIDEVFSLLPDNFHGGKWVVFYIGLSQLFNIASGVNGTIIINSKYYRYDLYTNVVLVFITIATNYILIPKYGIDGAAMATAISVLLFNMIRLVLIKVKMNMQPFSKQTVITFFVLLVVYFIVDLFPLSSVVIFDIIWKSLLALLLFAPIVLKLNLSEDISGIVKDLKNRLIN
jgi:O-antigen/teichoic acid export membrane protein